MRTEEEILEAIAQGQFMTRDEYYRMYSQAQEKKAREEMLNMRNADVFYKAIGSQIYGGAGSRVGPNSTLTLEEQMELVKSLIQREDEVNHKVLNMVSKTLKAIVEQAVQGLARLTRVSLVGTDVESDIVVSEDEIVIKLKPLNRYARLVFEEIKEQYTTEELKRG